MLVATSWTHLLSQENEIDVVWQVPQKGLDLIYSYKKRDSLLCVDIKTLLRGECSVVRNVL